jgi:hypothetical protein
VVDFKLYPILNVNGNTTKLHLRVDIETNQKGVEREILKYLCKLTARNDCREVSMTRTNLAGDKYFKDVEILTHRYHQKEKIYDPNYRIQAFEILIGLDSELVDDSQDSKDSI